jgi:drug/metabolite transporter (DMT)-like permease
LAALFAWLLLGERLTPVQIAGGALILAGIAAVRAERSVTLAEEPGAVTHAPDAIAASIR